MRIVTRRPARISAARTRRPARPTVPLADTTRSTSIAAPSAVGRGQRRWPGGAAAGGGQAGQVGGGQVGADGLEPGAAGEQVDDVVVGPERDRDPGPGRAQPELLARHRQVPRGGHDPVELDRPRGRRPAAAAAGPGSGSGRSPAAGPGRRPGRRGAAAATPPARRRGPGRTGRRARPCPGTGAGGGCCSPRPPSASRAACTASRSAKGPWSASRSRRRVWWKRSIFPVVVGVAGWVRRCTMPLSRQIRSNSTSPPRPNRAVNCLPLSVRTSSGTP